MELHACPYCGCHAVEVVENLDGGVVVACPGCGMSGPESVDGDEAEAVRGWEILCSRMCNKCRRVYIQRILELRRRLDAIGASADT